jgi:hypothetical protein
MSNLIIDTIQARSDEVEERAYELGEAEQEIPMSNRKQAEFLAAVIKSQSDVMVLLKVVQTLRGMLDTQMSEALVDQIITEAAQSV